jgi:hypothetical protein
MEAHVNGPTNRHDKGHAGETSEAGHVKDHGEQARKEAHQPRGAAEKVKRLMQLYSAQDLTGLNAEERTAQEQEMLKVYTTFDEEGLDTALAIAESVALAKAESRGERTPSRPTESLAATKQPGARTDTARADRGRGHCPANPPEAEHAKDGQAQ